MYMKFFYFLSFMRVHWREARNLIQMVILLYFCSFLCYFGQIWCNKISKIYAERAPFIGAIWDEFDQHAVAP